MSFGKRLKMLRSDKEITQIQLSEILDTAKSNISKYEADTIEPNISMLCKLAKYFNVSVDYLIGISNEKLSYGMTSYSSVSNKLDISCGESIAYWIRKTGLGDDEITKQLGITEKLLENYRSGKEDMPLDILVTLSKLCGVSTDCLLGLRDRSRPEHGGELPFRFDPEISRRLKEQARQMDESYSVIADILGIEEKEVHDFFEYGFVPHISVFVQIVEHFLVSSDYLLNRTGSTLTLQADEEELLRSYRALNAKSRTMALSRIYELEREESLVAARDRYLDDSGKSLPSSGTGGVKVG